MSSSGPSITVGIATLDRYPYVEALLDDLAGQTRLPDEVLIVDQTPAQRRQNLQAEKWNQVFSLRVMFQDERSTTKARNILLRECRSDIILKPDDDVRIESTYVENHARHFVDSRIDVVNGPVYEWDTLKHEWYVKWRSHLMLEGPNGRAFVTPHAYSGGNSSIRVASALAVGGWDENIVTYGEDDDFSYRLDRAGAVCLFDPHARLRHLRAPRGGERDTEWGGSVGPGGNWHVLAGLLYFRLSTTPLYSAFRDMRDVALQPFVPMKHGRVMDLRVLAQVLVALPVSLWRWWRGPLLIDSHTPDRQIRRFTKKEVLQQRGKLARRQPRAVLVDVEPPHLLP